MLDLGVPDVAARGITGTSTGVGGTERLLVARTGLPRSSVSKFLP
jgi:hypothetical protein